MFRGISNREKKLAFITITIVAIVFIYNFIIEPLTFKLVSLDKEIKDKEAVLARYRRTLSDKNDIEMLHSKYAKYLKAKKNLDEECAISLSVIEKCARDTAVTITSIKPLGSKSEAGYIKTMFRISTESALSALTKFIYDIQSSDQLLKVERIVLRTKENDPATIRSIINVTKLTLFEPSKN